MELIIAGYGFVGKAVANSLQSTNTLRIVDPKYTTAEMVHFPDADGVIICVGTPSDIVGDCDVTQIRDVMENTPTHIPVLIKSTVPPDYLEHLLKEFPEHSICYSPEFLRAVSANEDFLNQTYMVIGGVDPDNMWQTLFETSLPNCRDFFNVNITEASMVKYVTNCFLSLKVAFFNQIYDMCQANGADYKKVIDVLLQDSRIGNSHMQVPGPDGSRGFGGACFPKDTLAFVHYCNRIQITHSLVESAIKYNKKVRKSS